MDNVVRISAAQYKNWTSSGQCLCRLFLAGTLYLTMGWKNVNAIIENKLYLGKYVAMFFISVHMYLLSIPCVVYCQLDHLDR